MDEEIVGRLKRRMDQLGLNTTALAEMVGEAQQTVSRWVNGTSKIPARFIGACEEAGVANARWLLTGRGAPDVVEGEAQEILEAVRALVAYRPVRSRATSETVLELLDDVQSDPRPDPDKRQDAGG